MFENALHKANIGRHVRCALCVLAVLMVAQLARADFDWFNANTNRVTYADGLSPLPGDISNSNAAAFVQLIWAGPDGTNNPAVNTGEGVTGDDVVHVKSWIGRGSFPPNAGIMPQFETFKEDSNGYYYVRVWTAPSDDYIQGDVPSAATNFYGDSRLWLNPGSGLPITPDEFNFGGNGDENNVGFAADRMPNADTDVDGIPDWWEFMFFTNSTSLANENTDFDMDGQLDINEFRSKTIPTDDMSVFKLDSIDHPSPTNGPLVKWQSATNAVYTVSRTTNLLDIGSFELIATNMAATPPQNCFTDAVSAAGAYIYAIGIQD